MSTATIVLKLKNLFSTYGCPYKLRTDSAKYFSGAEFKEFCAKYDIEHCMSSSYFSQSNGQAESAVKIAKRCLMQDDPFEALMLYRTTPLAATGYSPARLMLGREIRT